MVFRYFVNWVYTSDLAPFPYWKPMGVVDLMIDMYVFADRILCAELKNRAMDMIQAACTYQHITVKNVTKAIRSSQGRSMMTDCLVKQLAWDMCDSAIGHEGYMVTEGWNDLVVADAQATSMLMRQLLLWQRADPPKSHVENAEKEQGCQWHVHPDVKGPEECERWKPRGLGVVNADD